MAIDEDWAVSYRHNFNLEDARQLTLQCGPYW